MIGRRHISIRGVMQGIGFRPFVYRLAKTDDLRGFVLNGASGVTLEIQGDKRRLDIFEDRLFADLPPGGRIDQFQTSEVDVVPGDSDFFILASDEEEGTSVSLAPDRNLCAECLQEMRDPSDRRYGYPFNNCTACGPRYTITKRLPYDRPQTTMASFKMCDDCEKEYTDPLTRRYHAQPIACPVCGPAVRFISDGVDEIGSDGIERATASLRAGQIVAVKGIGGFHLAVDAANRDAVLRLRELKSRPTQPMAVMVRDVDVAKKWVQLSAEAKRLLSCPASPIVLAPIRGDCEAVDWLAPHLGELGIMIPYTPLHLLLFDSGPEALVVTSGNRASEPITISNEVALSELEADGSLVHNRDIHVACDDSVVRSGTFGEVFIRRARGYVPEAITGDHLPDCEVVALGAQLKVTVSTLKNRQLVVGRHLGNLDNSLAETAFREEVVRMIDFGKVNPEVVAVDAHPDVPSRFLAEELFESVPVSTVQHHHAHMAAVMVEHAMTTEDEVVGIIMDGFGYGWDGAIWGGECLVGGYGTFTRAGHLRYVPQPGGDRGALEPKRMATAYLLDAGLENAGHPAFEQQFAEICAVPVVSPMTSSAGRLFDGVAALLGIAPDVQTYEGEAAARLEASADPSHAEAYPLPSKKGILDVRVLLRSLVNDDASVGIKAARFINGLADGFADLALETEKEKVVLGGGCVVNQLLTRRLVSVLESAGRLVFVPRRLPPGDGGVSAGQAAVAASSLRKGK